MIFDTEIHPDDVKSPTKKIEKIEDDFHIETQNGTPVKEKDTKDEQDKKDSKEEKSKLREAIEFCIPIVAAIILAILLKSFVFANAIVPTGSMLNTIQEKDRIIASRLAYINSDPERYDIIIFAYPDDESQNYVKRVIGLPGETVEIVNGIVYVTKTDGETIQLDDSFVTNCIPEGDFGPFYVPEDSYFMLGDNRNSSWDSRYWKNKYVHKDKILGQVKFRYFPNISKIE
ncbi:MAG: signal peptidase I [Eubacterium sp.]|nr:signal peptidase I [Eubacterium sp.]